MNILVINCGSSTVKFQWIASDPGASGLGGQTKLARGLVDRLGVAAHARFAGSGGRSRDERIPVEDHEGAVALIIDWLQSDFAEYGGIDGVGHRVVHGGPDHYEPVRLDAGVIDELEALNELAPLHNPPALSGIRAARRILGTAMPMVAVFDTAFHHSMPATAATYALPFELSSKHRIRRYGFHGLAHRYSLLRYSALAAVPADRCSLITLHLGNGCSACAIRGGSSVDTSMGFTPLEGLVMGTRSGDLDPALTRYLALKEGLSADEVDDLLNRHSGLLGVSGATNDMRELIGAYDQNPRARLAVELFCYRARKYVGAYLAALGGAEAVVFSGGIGENAGFVRERICAGMQWCGLHLDGARNAGLAGTDGMIAADDSAVKVYVVHTDEEAIIARDAVDTIVK